MKVIKIGKRILLGITVVASGFFVAYRVGTYNSDCVYLNASIVQEYVSETLDSVSNKLDVDIGDDSSISSDITIEPQNQDQENQIAINSPKESGTKTKQTSTSTNKDTSKSSSSSTKSNSSTSTNKSTSKNSSTSKSNSSSSSKSNNNSSTSKDTSSSSKNTNTSQNSSSNSSSNNSSNSSNKTNTTSKTSEDTSKNNTSDNNTNSNSSSDTNSQKLSDTETTTSPTPTETSTKYTGTINNTLASELQTKMNQYRTSLGLSSLTYDSSLKTYADTRAKEISVSFSHTRPNGSYAVSSSSKYKSEIIAGGTSKRAAFILSGWKNSSAHNKIMTSTLYTKFAISCYQTGNYTYCVTIFSS